MITPEQQKLIDDIKTLSDNPNTQTAALLIRDGEAIAAGTNRLPAGVKKLPDRCVRPAYYKWICHAERDALLWCAKTGIRTQGLTMIMEWFPCVDCARAIIQAGIGELHCGQPNLEDPTWGEDFKIAVAMLEESDVNIVWND